MLTKLYPLLLIITLCCGCSSEPSNSDSQRMPNQKAEYIYRKQNESLIHTPLAEALPPKVYPWHNHNTGSHQKITKEFFRCKGCPLNPPHFVQQNGEPQCYHDCGGPQKHSLPLRDSKEFIYPILIELVNYLQNETNKKVIITSGHRCIEHNNYVDFSPENQHSKHMIGAEVSLYILGLESQPESVVNHLINFYKNSSKYRDKKEYTEFKRYEKSDSNITIQPWYNKEIFIKLFNKKEGRNFDNRHPYPYVSIQVRHDRDLNERVIYSWEKAYRNFHRW